MIDFHLEVPKRCGRELLFLRFRGVGFQTHAKLTSPEGLIVVHCWRS